ncbi:MAG: fructosamine kinase family protein [Deltaproteobacteria bacterium]|nr:fructosamine kinase family protein [Deltaproteobacteria bacterium]
MRFEAEVSEWIARRGEGDIDRCESIAGGDINEAFRITTNQGTNYFLKRHANPPPQMFEVEALGLEALRNALASCEATALRVPQVFLWGASFLLLEDLHPAPKRPDYWQALGRGLAEIHNDTRTCFGFSQDHQGQSRQIDNYCGLTPQPNPRMTDGYAFFAEARLTHQATLAADKGLLTPTDLSDVENLCRRLPQLIPEQPASLIHGDLWSGNAHCGPNGEPALIDPAAHWGWAEAEIAMTRLFGGFAPGFYDAYLEVRPLDPGWERRLDLYNLYHVLNHANLFGHGYVGQARTILRKYL